MTESSIDQNVLMMPDDLKPLDEADEVVASGNPMLVFEWVRSCRKRIQAGTIAICKALAKMEAEWDDTDKDFLTVAETETGYSRQTINKYTRVWWSLSTYLLRREDIPDEIKRMILGKPIKSLLLIAPNAENIDWNDVAYADTENELREVIGSTRTSAISRLEIRITRDGTLESRIGDGLFEPFGFFNLKSETKAGQKAIIKLINAGQILEV